MNRSAMSRLPAKCAHCRVRFTPDERAKGLKLHETCHEPFAEDYASKAHRSNVRKAASLARKAAKAEREKDAVRKDKLKSITERENECLAIVQKIARIRDRHDGCISCHLPATWDGQWHGSHFRSVGACSGTQFSLWNIHKACSSCNRDKGGNIHNYRPRLIEKVGQEKYDWIMAQNHVTKRAGPDYIEYLKRFKRVMGKRCRRMERAAQRGA